MAGPGGSEHGRINVKVVPDTDGFTAKVDSKLAKYENADIDVKVKADTEQAEAELKKLTQKYRTLEIRVQLTNLIAVEAKLTQLTADKTVKLNVTADTATASAQIAAIANTQHTAQIQAVANTTQANAQINRAARNRTTKIRYRFVGSEAVKRLQDLTRDKVQHIKLDFDDKNFRTKLRAIGRNNEILAEVDIDPRSVRDVRRWIGSLGRDFKEVGQELRKNFDRIQALKLAADQRRAAQLLDRAHAAALREQARRDVQAARDRLNREQSLQRRLRAGYRVLEREYRKLGRPLPVEVELETGNFYRKIGLLRREMARVRRERLDVNVDIDYDRINRVFEMLRMRNHRIEVDVDVDRNRLGRIGRLFSRVFAGAGGVARSALSGVLKGISLAFASLGNFGNLGQRVFGNLANSVGGASGKLGNLANVIGQVVASLLAIGVVVGILFTVINTLGALIVAAIGAVAAIGSVVLGAAALLALPAIFAGIAGALISMGNKNDKIKRHFSDLAQTIRGAVTKTAKPMLDLFSSSLEGLNRALRKGTPLYKELSSAFTQSAKALDPLREGLYLFGLQTLRGVNVALKNLNSNGSMRMFSLGIAGLGNVIGGFASNLSRYAPAFSTGFDSLVSGLNRIQAALARWMGAFAQFSPSVIEGFTGAFEALFDTFASNAQVFTLAAASLGTAIRDATPGIHKIATAFAQMAPGIFDALAEGINNLGDALNDPQVVQGLVNITSGIIKFTSVLLKWATQITGKIGNQFSEMRRSWELTTGTLNRGIDISVSEFQRVIRQEKSARDRVNIGLRQLDASVSRHTSNISDGIRKYQLQLVMMLSDSDKHVSDHVRGLGTKLQEMSNQWKDAAGKVSGDWKKSWDALSKQIDQSGNSALIGIKNQMSSLMADSTRFREKLKSNLIAALKAEGVDVSDTVIQKIDQQLGLLVTNSQTKSAEAVKAFEQNFARLPGLVQAAMEEAKTPEQFQQKMEKINEVMASMTPKIAASFAKLPTAMQKTLTESEAAFQTWKGMEVFRQKVTEGVKGAVAQFQQLSNTIVGLNTPLSILGGQVTLMAGFVQGLNAQSNWLNWILNQVGAQAAWAGWNMGQLAANASRAAGTVAALNAGANGLQAAFSRAGSSAGVAGAAIGNFGWNASQAGARMSAFATAVSRAMTVAFQAVGAWTWAMEQRLARFQQNAARYGNLSAFVSAVSASMRAAESAVSSAVNRMLGQLHRLNTTVTAHVNVQTQNVPAPNNLVPNNFAPSFAPFGAFAAPLVADFQPLAAETPSSAAAGTVAWRQSADKQMREALRESASRADAVGDTYNVNVEAAPYVPTEKTIVTALSYADALYAT